MAGRQVMLTTFSLLSVLFKNALSSPMPSTVLSKRCLDEGEDSHHCQGEAHMALPFDNTDAISRNGVYLGMYPNPSETLCDLEGIVNAAFAFHGIRIELKSEQVWTANEVSASMVDLQKTKAVLQLAIVPDSTWWGFTEENDCQAIAIAKEIGKIRQRLGRPVWLNFAPEMNCRSPSTRSAYPNKSGQTVARRSSPQSSVEIEGDLAKRHHQPPLADAFIVAWQLVYKAVMAETPDTKMIWSPGPADNKREYHQFWPKHAVPHIVGMTYEPTRTFSADEFSDILQPFHDDFASAERPLLLAHTAPAIRGISENRRIRFLNVITSEAATASMPYYFGAVYHNFKNRADKRVIILPAEGGRRYETMNRKMKRWVQTAE